MKLIVLFILIIFNSSSSFSSGYIFEKNCNVTARQYCTAGNPKVLATNEQEINYCIQDYNNWLAAQSCPIMPEDRTIIEDEIVEEDPSSSTQATQATQPTAVTTSYPAAKQSELEQAVQACKNEESTLLSVCAPDRNSDMAQASALINTLSLGFAASASSGIQQSCSTMGKVAQGITAALGAFKGTCAPIQASCTSKCSDAYRLSMAKEDWCDVQESKASQAGQSFSCWKSESEQPSEVYAMANVCGNYQQTLAEAGSQLMSFGTILSNAQNCEEATTASSNKSKTYCETYPNDSICLQAGGNDCSNPAISYTAKCVCEKNPQDPICGTTSAGKLSASSKAFGSNGEQGYSQDDLNAMLAANGNPMYGTIPPVAGSPQGVNEIPGGRGRGLPGGGASSGAAYGAVGGGSAGSGGSGGGNFKTSVYGGLSGGSGGSGGRGSFGSGSSYNGKSKYAKGTSASGRKGKSGFDLKAYLPGGKHDPKRGLAGQVGPDGITGANGPSLWTKVRARYQYVRPKLMP